MPPKRGRYRFIQGTKWAAAGCSPTSTITYLYPTSLVDHGPVVGMVFRAPPFALVGGPGGLALFPVIFVLGAKKI